MSRVFGYCRVSTMMQVEDGESLGVQERQIRGYAQMHGYTIEAVFVEEGVSGSKPIAERPEGAKLLAQLQAGDVVIAAKLDRVFRSALDALQTIDTFKAKGIHLHLIDLGGDVSGNGLSKLFLTVAAAFAEAERDRIRERIAGVKADQRDRGRFLGGAVPFGFRVEDGGLVEDQGQQAALSKAKAMRAGGSSFRAIAAAVKKDGYIVSHVTLSKILGDVAGPNPIFSA